MGFFATTAPFFKNPWGLIDAPLPKKYLQNLWVGIPVWSYDLPRIQTGRLASTWALTQSSCAWRPTVDPAADLSASLSPSSLGNGHALAGDGLGGWSRSTWA